MNLEKYFSSDAPDSFYTLDVTKLKQNARHFTECFPGKVLYAMKANPLPEVIAALIEGGISHFDVASLGEIEAVSRQHPDAAQYFMNPVKSRDAIDRAYREHGVRSFVVDSESELRKMRDVLPSSDEGVIVYVRYAPSASGAVFDLRGKFGATLDETLALADAAEASTRWRLGLSFHVGSQVTQLEPYMTALDDAEHLIRRMGSSIHALDIGGGFPGTYVNSYGDGVPMLSQIIERIETSPALRSLELICEIGRGLVHNSMSLFARVVSRRRQDIFSAVGIFGGLLSAQQWLQFPVQVWRRGERYSSADRQTFQLFGPTCDSMDRLAFPYDLPADIDEGDWLEFQSVGAYSVSLRAPFNGFYTEDIVRVGR